MSNTVPLAASARTKDENLVNMRRAGKVPAIIYGNVANTMVQIEEMPLKKAHMKARL
jgi:ribosomal protein L25 (general stress protein Ctc)